MAHLPDKPDSKSHGVSRLTETLNGLHIATSQDRLDRSGAEPSYMKSAVALRTPSSPVKTSYHHEEADVPLGALREIARIPSFTPTHEANTSRRRVNHSILSRSPARPGHCSRMKQIFEDISKSNATILDQGKVQYPRLPVVLEPSSSTIFEKLDSSAFLRNVNYLRKSNVDAQEPLSAATKPSRTISIKFSETSSESWSGDSGYINAGPGVAQKAIEKSNSLVEDWLSGVSDANDDADSISNFISNSDIATDHTISVTSRRRDYATGDPFVSEPEQTDTESKISNRIPAATKKSRHISDTCKQLTFSSISRGTKMASQPPAKSVHISDAGLRVLSPNVCIERGASGQQPLKTSISPKSPKVATYDIYNGPKENLAAEAETLYSSQMRRDPSPTMRARAGPAVTSQGHDDARRRPKGPHHMVRVRNLMNFEKSNV
ncbi:unnamed protein product [Periconia digitata]|uniref:Uncharacterized protein n=1 Tax=Periconia digitata TaxID=1303443 RepID=A0A9W4UJC1_9PLEO|nr:unnamed protein product [Periconia digitata]